jgi:hypothetical protein
MQHLKALGLYLFFNFCPKVAYPILPKLTQCSIFIGEGVPRNLS